MKNIYLFLLFLPALVLGREPYSATMIVGPETAKVSATNILNLVTELKTTAIEQLAPLYTPTSSIAFDFNLRGIKTNAFFAANSTTLVYNVPQLGITETFTGSTRDESFKLYQDYIRNNGRNPKKTLRTYSKYTSIDPIAGNPNSLLYQMGDADYLLGQLTPDSPCDCSSQFQPIPHLFQVGLNTGRAFSAGFETTAIQVPLRYSYSPFGTFAFILDAPIELLVNGGAYSLDGSLGVALLYPLTENWSLTPTVRLGFGGSIDLAAAGTFFSSGLTSAYHIPLEWASLTITNYAGYYSSLPFHLGGINFDYHLYSFVFKNGLKLTSCDLFEICKRPIYFSASFTDTVYPGHFLFIKQYDEVGFSIFSTNINPCLDYDSLSLGIYYQFGQHNYKGYFLDLAYQF